MKKLGRERESLGDQFFNQLKKEKTMAKKKLVVFRGRKVHEFVVKSAKNTLDYDIGEHITKVDLDHLMQSAGYEIDLVGRPR